MILSEYNTAFHRFWQAARDNNEFEMLLCLSSLVSCCADAVSMLPNDAQNMIKRTLTVTNYLLSSEVIFAASNY